MYGEDKAKTPQQLNATKPNTVPAKKNSIPKPIKTKKNLPSVINTPVKKSQPSVLNNIFNHFGIDGKDKNITIDDQENEKIKSSLSDLQDQYQKITSNENNMKNLKRESLLLSHAQNALDEIKEEPTKVALEKQLEQRDKDSTDVLSYLQSIGAVKNGSVDKNKLQERIESNHNLQSDHLDKEVKLLKTLSSLKGLSGSESNGIKTVLENEIKDSIDSKLSQKKDQKESKRKKHWYERIFFHNNDDEDKNNTTTNSEEPPKFLQKLKMDLSSPEMSFFVYFCFISITIFTITLFSAYNSKEIYDANTDLMKQTQAFYIFGLVVLILFLISLSLSFGHDKDLKQKLASFILINGTIYLGAFYTYLESNGNLEGLSKYEKLTSQLVVAGFIVFLLGSAAYILSEKRKGTVGRIFGIIYLLTCLVGFFVLGSVVTSFNARLTIPKGNKETLLIPLCTAFFVIGIALFTSAVIDSIPSVNEGISNSLNKIINVLEPTRVKLLIVAGLVMSIYYTYTFYKIYNSKYISGDPSDPSKFPDKKNTGINKLLEPTYTIGLGLIAAIIFSLSLSFGGTLKEKAAAVFLISFVIFCGSYISYLQGEGKIENTSKMENSMVIGSIVVFMILLVACIFYVLFDKHSGNGVLIQDSLKIVSSFGSLIFFFYVFGIGTAVVFQEFLGENSGTEEGSLLWAAFGISLAIILVFIGSYFI